MTSGDSNQSAAEWLDGWLDDNLEFVEESVAMKSVADAFLAAANKIGFLNSDIEQAAGGNLTKYLSDEREYDTTISDENTRDA